MTPMELPHSEIPGSKRACRSPRHIAACHVLLRLSVPRHPPSTLSNLTIKCLDLMRSAVHMSTQTYSCISLSTTRIQLSTNPAVAKTSGELELFFVRAHRSSRGWLMSCVRDLTTGSHLLFRLSHLRVFIRRVNRIC